MFALKNSLIVAVATTVIATTLGTRAAYGLSRADFPAKAIVFGILISPLAVPVVITALGIYFFFARVGLVHTHIGLILAHVALADRHRRRLPIPCCLLYTSPSPRD